MDQFGYGKRKRNTDRRALAELTEISKSTSAYAEKHTGIKKAATYALIICALAVTVGIASALYAPMRARSYEKMAPDWTPSTSADTEAEDVITVMRQVPDEIFNASPETTEIIAAALEDDEDDGGTIIGEYVAAKYLAPPQAEDRRYTVELSFYGGDTITIDTPPITVGELLDSLDIEINENQQLRLPLDSMIRDDMTIEVDSVTTSTSTETKAIPYGIKYEDVITIPRGTTKLVSAGQNGETTYYYADEYVNGELVSHTLTGEKVTKYPVDAVYKRGVGGTVTGADGVTRSFSYMIQVTATTYTGGGYTYTGRPATEAVIAVDPRVIPLNTKVYVKGNYGDFGVRVAADIGGGIKGNIIDVYLDETNPKFASFGLRRMYVYILD